MPKKIDPALRDRAVRLVRERRSEYSSLTAASAAVARQVGVGDESVRRWVLQADSSPEEGVARLRKVYKEALRPCANGAIDESYLSVLTKGQQF
jgi:transposase-like protein